VEGWGSGFRVQGSGFRVQGSGCKVKGVRFSIWIIKNTGWSLVGGWAGAISHMQSPTFFFFVTRGLLESDRINQVRTVCTG